MKKELENIIKKAVFNLFRFEQVDFSPIKSANSGAELFNGVNVDYPTVEKFGDYTTNVAMVLGKILKKNPMEIAEKLKAESLKLKAIDFAKIEVVAPGYINFYLSIKYLQDKVAEINSEKENFGSVEKGRGKKVQIEFISSNPTGPIHLGNGRGGPIGDALGNVLEKIGYDVEREFYVNDFGNQVEVLGHSILGDDKAQYNGDYVEDLKGKIDKDLTDPMEIGNLAAGTVLNDLIKPTCEKLGVKFNNWFSEKSLHDAGKVDEVVALLRERGLLYESEGATWYKSTDFGDDKDRVLIKSNGNKTYLATDFAYHKNKIERGFDGLINIQGADHHKEVEVVRMFIENVLGEKNKFHSILSQFVRVIKEGKEVKMSKRRGVYFALDDLIEEVGKDAVRFIFTSYAANSHINFDINLAKERSEKNPVFYVQYAHARICSILAKAESQKLKACLPVGMAESDGNLELLIHEKELSLIRELDKFPELVAEISETYEVHKLPYYAIKIADKFHSFYNDCRVIDEENLALTKARLGLITAVQIVLAETLRLIGVTAPEKM